MLRFIVALTWSSISIHTMLHFIPRKYKIPLLRDICILTHKSAFFNTFYQPFSIFFITTLYIQKSSHLSVNFLHFLSPSGW